MIAKEAGIRSCRNRSCDTGYHKEYYVVIVLLLSCARLFVTPWTATHQVPLYSTTYWSLLKYMSIVQRISSHPLLPPSPFDSSPSQDHSPFQWLFKSDGQNIGVSASIFPMNIQGYFPFESNQVWLDLLAVQGILKSLLQHQVQKIQFFGTQLSL